MPYEPPPYLAELTLAEIADLVAQRKLPAVEGWAPQKAGDSKMRIAADGTWYHEGDPIRREAMVRAFAGLLKRDEDGQYWLVTPFEKLTIEVEDAAFIAVDCARADDALVFRLNTDDLVIAGPDHPLRAAGDAETPALYLHVRRGCEARLNRSTWAQLAEIALAEGADENGWQIASKGATFPLLP
ncbi:DUF1285 domain-containing protein [Erythrobacter dokdonensis]|jgi:hypothetical protein|uniref:DUF1285 domain-containing protein n=1 Tax=Erythrobacter dokdonensis DSW-74 TaxID=1300349 RepID=A0A1A7BJ05_9SPHN|nr:DUF1285 domain-containing protein [Erythrobacter dokdonensis]MEE4315973.1 DUF1285 domain-containing protein [Erythrobacter sp.]OBV11432.1 DUF1285 domain-containing protein [Erythrobacter dokdonensis DSW-74]